MKKNRTRKKERHWCLTLFLAVIFFSSFCKIFSPYLNVFYGKQNLLLSLLSFCHCVSVIAIFKWNKRGFWVFAITACLHMLLDVFEDGGNCEEYALSLVPDRDFEYH